MHICFSNLLNNLFFWISTSVCGIFCEKVSTQQHDFLDNQNCIFTSILIQAQINNLVEKSMNYLYD